MDKVLWRGVDGLSDGQDIASLRKMVLVSVMRRHFHTGDLVAGLDSPETLLAKLPSHELSTVADIAKGKTGIKDAKPGPYPLVVTAEARSECDHFDYEGPAVVIPMVSSTGHGDASLKRIHYQEGQYAVGTILAVVRPLNPDQLSARYLYEYLSAFKEELLVSRMVGTANVSLTVKKLGDVPVPLIPIESQRQIERLMALCDRLEADQADAEAAHAQLVQALLDSLTQATDAADVRASWQRLSEHFHTLFTTEASIDALKQTVLQLAVMGKLVPQSREDEPASALLRRADVDKARLIAEGVVRKERGSPAKQDVQDEPFSIPPGWLWAKKSAVLRFLNGYAFKSEWFRPEGVRLLRNINVGHGVVDWSDVACLPEEQADDFAAFALAVGDLVLTLDRPIISTGLKAAVIRDSDVPCLLLQRVAKLSPYAGCVVIDYLAVWLNSTFFIGAIDQGRSNGVPHISTSQVGDMLFALPPLAEQHRIVAKVDELMALCDQLKAQLTEARQQHAQLATVLVEQAVA